MVQSLRILVLIAAMASFAPAQRPIDDPFGGDPDPFGQAPPVPMGLNPAGLLADPFDATPSLDVTRAGLAKISDDPTVVTLAVPVWKVEKRTQVVNVQRSRTETRVRMVPKGTPQPGDTGRTAQAALQQPTKSPIETRGKVGMDAVGGTGEMVPQTYQVTVPFTEQIEQNVNVMVADGLKPQPVPIEKVTAWTRDGLKLDSRSLGELLSVPRPVMRLRRPLAADFELNRAQQKILANDTLFLLIEASAGVGW